MPLRCPGPWIPPVTWPGHVTPTFYLSLDADSCVHMFRARLVEAKVNETLRTHAYLCIDLGGFRIWSKGGGTDEIFCGLNYLF